MPKTVTRVTFRIESIGNGNTQVAAVLPDVEAKPGKWICYARIGQHSECSPAWYYSTRTATPAQYASLLTELRGIYETGRDAVQLKVVRRIARTPRS